MSPGPPDRRRRRGGRGRALCWTPSTRCSTGSSSERRDERPRARWPPRSASARRLARELHDELGQTLTGVVLQLDGLGRAGAAASCRRRSRRRRRRPARGAEEVRDIARGLRPQALDEFGLRSALDHARRRLRRAQRAAGAPRARAATCRALAPEQDLAIYRVAQEGLTNVARHAEATGVAAARSRAADGGVVLRVRDDGRGIARPGARTTPAASAGCASARCSSAAASIVRAPRPCGTEVASRGAGGIARDASRCVTRILLADDHPVVRSGLRLVLDAAPDLQVVAEAADGIEAVELGLREDIDLADPRRRDAAAHRAAGRARAGPPPARSCGS